MEVGMTAKILDGSQYREEGSPEFFKAMKDAGLVAVFGASDDLMEFRGAIHDEVGAYDGGRAYLDDSGLLQNKCDDHDCPYFKRLLKRARTIDAVWCPDDSKSWAYVTDIPHAKFRVMEDDELYCEGIVFRLADATPKGGEYGNS